MAAVPKEFLAIDFARAQSWTPGALTAAAVNDCFT